MVDKTTSGLPLVESFEAGDLAYLIRSGNSRKIDIHAAIKAQVDVGGAGLAAHLADPIAAHQASAIAFASEAGLAATDVASALDELVERHYAIDVSDAAFGVHPSKTAAENMVALKAAIATMTDGKVLLIPEMGGIINIDTTGGLSGAAVLDKNDITVIIDGHIRANYSDNEADPAYIFRTTGRTIKFRGAGTIEGDGTFHVDGVSSITIPGLVYVEGDNFSSRGLRLRRPPQTAFMVVGDRASISRNHFEGGPTDWEPGVLAPEYTVENPAYTGSAHFHINATGGIDHDFSHNFFVPDEDGGTVVNAIFSSGVAGNARFCRIIGNFCLNPYEKLFYGYGDRNIVVGNTLRVTSSIYGLTDAIRCWGGYNLIALNIIEGFRGVCQVFDDTGSKVLFNTAVNIRNSGINVQHFTNIAGGFSGSVNYPVVKGNLIIRASGFPEEGDPRFAVRVAGHAEADLFGADVSDNILVGWGSGETEYAIDFIAGAGRQIQASKCNDNFLVACGSGIKALRLTKGGQISRNRFYAMTDVHIELLGCDNVDVDGNIGSEGGTWSLSEGTGGDASANIRYTNNRSTGVTNIGIRNHTFGAATENWAEGNQWTAKALIGGGVLDAAASTTITHGGIAPHASIILIPVSLGFASIVAARGMAAVRSSANILVFTGDTAAAAGGEAFRYKVIQ